jgi:hypothetical protein
MNSKFFLRVDEEILRFDISVNDIASVAESNSFYHLVDEVAETLRVDANCVFFEDFK